MEIDHIGYAVKNMEKAVRQMETLGYQTVECVEDESRKIRMTFMQLGEYRIELVSPLCEGSPVDGVLKNGAGPYHICYRTTKLEEEMERLVAQRYKVIIPPAPACAFGGRRVVFLYHLSIGLIEILEK